MSETTIEYKPRRGCNLSLEMAKKYGAHLASLIKQNGDKIKPSQVLEDAKRMESPIHSHFEWDDTEAAIKHRLDQARYLLRNIITTIIVEEKEVEQRSFWNVKEEGTQERIYITLKTAVETENYKHQLIDKITRHLENVMMLLKMFKEYDT